MKTFREYITEVELLSMRKNKLKGTATQDYDTEYYKHISTHPETGHHIYMSKGKYDSHIVAVHPKTKRIDMSVAGDHHKHKNGTSTFNIDLLRGAEGSKLKAHKFYSHLIKKHNMILHASEHSEGGKKVWQKLAKEPGVNIHGMHRNGRYSPVTKHPKPVDVVPTSKNEKATHRKDDYSMTNKELKAYDKLPKEEKKKHNDIMNMTLVAHKRIGKKPREDDDED